MTQSTPVEDERTAYRVATLPLEYGTTRINQLFTRGYNRYIVDGEDQPEDLFERPRRFGTAAFKEDIRANAAEEPFVDEPGTLAVLATLSAICVKGTPEVRTRPPRKVQVLHDIRELYINNLASLLREFGDGGASTGYRRGAVRERPGEGRTAPGRVCTGIKEMPEFGEGCIRNPNGCGIEGLVHADTRQERPENCSLASTTTASTFRLVISTRSIASTPDRAFKKLLRVQEENLSRRTS